MDKDKLDNGKETKLDNGKETKLDNGKETKLDNKRLISNLNKYNLDNVDVIDVLDDYDIDDIERDVIKKYNVKHNIKTRKTNNYKKPKFRKHLANNQLADSNEENNYGVNDMTDEYDLDDQVQNIEQTVEHEHDGTCECRHVSVKSGRHAKLNRTVIKKQGNNGKIRDTAEIIIAKQKARSAKRMAACDGGGYVM